MPAPVVSRALKITYGSLVMGGATDYHIHGTTTLDKGYTEQTLSFDIVCHDPSSSTFEAECQALEDGIRTPNLDLKAEFGSDSWFTLTHDGNTGMNAVGTCRKIGSPADSQLSRLYRCAITVQLPADEAGKNGRQSASIRVVQDATEILSVSVSAVYTAIAGSGSYAKATTNFPVYTATVKDDLGGTWDETSRAVYRYDTENKLCSAEAAYRQVIFGQSSGVLNNATLVGTNIIVSARRTSANAVPGANARPLTTVLVSFATGVRKSQSTDLKSVWENTARSYVLTVAESLSGVTALAVVTENPVYDPVDNRIHATMVCVGSESNLIAATQNTGTVESPSAFYVDVANGDPWARDRHTGPARKVVVIRTEIVELDTGGGSANFSVHINAVNRTIRSGYVLLSEAQPTDVVQVHTIPGMGKRVQVRRRVRKTTLDRANVVRGGGTGGTRAGSNQTRTRG